MPPEDVDRVMFLLADGSKRFRFRRDHDRQIARQAMELVEERFLLKGDAIPMTFEANDSNVGLDERCASVEGS